MTCHSDDKIKLLREAVRAGYDAVRFLHTIKVDEVLGSPDKGYPFMQYRFSKDKTPQDTMDVYAVVRCEDNKFVEEYRGTYSDCGEYESAIRVDAEFSYLISKGYGL